MKLNIEIIRYNVSAPKDVSLEKFCLLLTSVMDNDEQMTVGMILRNMYKDYRNFIVLMEYIDISNGHAERPLDRI